MCPILCEHFCRCVSSQDAEASSVEAIEDIEKLKPPLGQLEPCMKSMAIDDTVPSPKAEVRAPNENLSKWMQPGAPFTSAEDNHNPALSCNLAFTVADGVWRHIRGSSEEGRGANGSYWSLTNSLSPSTPCVGYPSAPAPD